MRNSRMDEYALAIAQKFQSKPNAIRARIDLIAYERGLSESEIAKAKTCDPLVLHEFAARHDLDVDWLVFGDIRGLKRMARP